MILAILQFPEKIPFVNAKLRNQLKYGAITCLTAVRNNGKMFTCATALFFTDVIWFSISVILGVSRYIESQSRSKFHRFWWPSLGMYRLIDPNNCDNLLQMRLAPTFVTCELAFSFNFDFVTFRFNYVTMLALLAAVLGRPNGVAKIILGTSGFRWSNRKMLNYFIRISTSSKHCCIKKFYFCCKLSL